ncbi:DUF5753 domain-containing protein [Streptomyces sp. NBC_01602]
MKPPRPAPRSASALGPTVQRLADVRMRRQQLLTTKNPPDLWTVTHESSLKHVVGSRAAMTGQLERVLDTARFRNVTVQSLPHNVGGYPATGLFTILGFTEQEDPDMDE